MMKIKRICGILLCFPLLGVCLFSASIGAVAHAQSFAFSFNDASATTPPQEITYVPAGTDTTQTTTVETLSSTPEGQDATQPAADPTAEATLPPMATIAPAGDQQTAGDGSDAAKEQTEATPTPATQEAAPTATAAPSSFQQSARGTGGVYYGKTLKPGVNVRTGRSSDTHVERAIPITGTVVVMIEEFTNSSGEKWISVWIDGDEGYIRADLLEPLTSEEIVQWEVQMPKEWSNVYEPENPDIPPSSGAPANADTGTGGDSMILSVDTTVTQPPAVDAQQATTAPLVTEAPAATAAPVATTAPQTNTNSGSSLTGSSTDGSGESALTGYSQPVKPLLP